MSELGKCTIYFNGKVLPCENLEIEIDSEFSGHERVVMSARALLDNAVVTLKQLDSGTVVMITEETRKIEAYELKALPSTDLPIQTVEDDRPYWRRQKRGKGNKFKRT